MDGSFKALLFLVLISVLVIFLGAEMGGRQGLLLGVGLALSINCLVYFYGELRAVDLFGGQKLEGQDPWGIRQIVQNKARILKIPAPTIYLLPSATPQALTLGRSRSHAKIFLTEGVFKKFGAREWEALVAYQMACIARMDTLAYHFASAGSDFILSFAKVADRLLAWLIGRKNDGETSLLITTLLSPLAGLLAHLAVGRGNYLKADRLASEVCGDAKLMAELLWKLESFSATNPLKAPAAAAPMFIVNPLTKRGIGRYFQTQPSVRKRILNLVGYYPI